MSDPTFAQEWLAALKQSPRQADVKDIEDLIDIVEALESALKAKDKDIQIKDGMLKLEIIAHREQLAELAVECLPHLESSLARTEKRLTKCKHDNLTKLNTLMANEKRALIAKLKLLVNK